MSRTTVRNDKNIAAIYCRLSEEDHNKKNSDQDSESIFNQMLLLTQYAKEHDWAIYDCYSDDDFTGADRNRPSFNRLLKDAENHKFNIILCKTQSRFTREVELVEKYIHGLFPIWGIRFVSIVDNADTDIHGNKKSRQINALINEWYLEDMSDNIRAVLTSRRKQGYYIGSVPLYGYRKDPAKKGHLIIDPEAAEVVRIIFQSYANGMGKTAIARMLNEKEIPNPTEYKRVNGIISGTPPHKTGTLWKYYTIADMLENEMYLGNLVQGKYASSSYKTKINRPVPREHWIRAEQTHEAIIDRSLWNTVQKIRSEHAKPFSSGELGIFARKARCAHCGYTMRSAKSHGKHYLQCTTRRNAPDACIGSFLSVETLEQIVLEELKHINASFLDQKQLIHMITLNNNKKEQLRKLEQKKTAFEQKLKRINTGVKNLYLDKITGDISPEQFQILAEELNTRRIRLSRQVSDLDTDIHILAEQIPQSENKHDLIKKYINIKKLNRSIVTKLIDYIVICKRDPDTNIVKIEIHWNF